MRCLPVCGTYLCVVHTDMWCLWYLHLYGANRDVVPTCMLCHEGFGAYLYVVSGMWCLPVYGTRKGMVPARMWCLLVCGSRDVVPTCMWFQGCGAYLYVVPGMWCLPVCGSRDAVPICMWFQGCGAYLYVVPGMWCLPVCGASREAREAAWTVLDIRWSAIGATVITASTQRVSQLSVCHSNR